MRFWSSYLIVILSMILGMASCSMARRSNELASEAANHPRILDVDCSALIPNAAITNVRGRLTRLPGTSDAVSGAISFSDRNQAATVSNLWSGEVSGSIEEDPDQVHMTLTTPDPRSTMQRVQIRVGKDPSLLSTLSMSALPDIPLRCVVARFSNTSISRTFPVCNGAGTRTAGWYVDGKLVIHDAECVNKVSACVSGEAADGWQIFTKTNRRAVIYSRCGGEQLLPLCEQAGSSLQGWYFRGKLLSADPQCHLRGISCEELGNKREGWYSHERVATKQLLAANCQQVPQYVAAPNVRHQKATLRTTLSPTLRTPLNTGGPAH